ncbi:MAG TPA: Cof-type HAD-IIB family hydrolase [Anaerolineales bacterium]|nr:Cof-type HAD-IIB family hydrolase [Anaerolineales bacterium]
MHKNDVKLVALDIDGTLLDPYHHLSPANIAAVRAVQAQGIRVVIATGKTSYAAQPLREQMGLDKLGVYIQGLDVIGSAGDPLRRTFLPNSLLQTALAFKSVHDVDWVAYSENNGIFANQPSARIARLDGYGEPPLQICEDWTQLKIHKLLAIAEVETLPGIRAALERAFHAQADIVQALTDMAEVLPLGASKGDGLAALLTHLGIDWENVLAIGDGENDIHMIRNAGWGVAMGNAHPELKAVARFHTASNRENGVAHALHTLLL